MAFVGKSKLLIAALVAGVLFSATGCDYLLPQEEEPLAPPLVKAKELVYRTEEVQRKDIEKKEVRNARANAALRETVFYDYSGGRIEEIPVSNGDEVKKGDVLVQLNTGDLKYEIDRANIAVQKAKLLLQDKQANPDSTESDIRKAELDVRTANSTLSQLINKRNNAVLKSPIDGIVTFVTSLKQGDHVQAYESLVTVSDITQLNLTFEETTGSNAFKVGMEVELTYKNESYPGVVVSAPFDRPELVPDNQKNTVFIGCDPELIAQMNQGDEVRVTAVIERRENTLVISRSVISTQGSRRYVNVLVTDGDTQVREERDVKLGIETSTEAEILEGLAEGDLVIRH